MIGWGKVKQESRTLFGDRQRFHNTEKAMKGRKVTPRMFEKKNLKKSVVLVPKIKMS